MRIVHLSDFHLNTFYTNSNLDKIEKILKEVTSHPFDHIVITGDLTDNAANDDFILLRGLFKSFGLLDTQKLSLVIGNHDLFGGVQTAEDIITFPERCAQTNYKEQVKKFRDYFPEVFDNCVYSSENVFPFAKIIKGVLIIGINSIAPYSKIKNPFASNGKISIEQLYELNLILNSYGAAAETRVILVHHHFNKIKIKPGNSSYFWHNIEKQTMRLRKKKRLFELFNEHKVDVIFHGHLHENNVYERKRLKFINSGGCVKGGTNDCLIINYVDIANGIVRVTSHKIPSYETHNSGSSKKLITLPSIMN